MGWIIDSEEIFTYNFDKAKALAIMLLINLEKKKNWLEGFQPSVIEAVSIPSIYCISDHEKVKESLTVPGRVEIKREDRTETYNREYGYAVEEIKPHVYKAWAWLYSAIEEVKRDCGCYVRYRPFDPPYTRTCDKHAPEVMEKRLAD